MAKYFDEFDRLGEKNVLENLAHGLFTPARVNAARIWLDQIERERSDASQSEQLSIARDARDAAWAAARAARRANIMAIIAIIIAALSAIIVPVINIFLRK